MDKSKIAATLGSHGGKANFKKNGREHMRKISRKGIEANLKKHGKDFYSKLSAMGVEARRRKKEAAKLPLDNPTA